MLFCINSSMFSDNLNVFEKIKIASMAGFDGIEIWYYEIRNQNLSDIKKCLNDFNIKPTTLIGLSGWFENDGELMNVTDDEKEIFEECKKRINAATQIGCPYIIAVPSFSHRNHFASWQDGLNRYKKILELGKSIGCKPTMEFIGQSYQINNFFDCKKFLHDLYEDATMVIDSYHLWRGGGSMDNFHDYDKNKISFFHISDADKNIERTKHRDRDRVLPLDGRLDLNLFAKTIKNINYNGFVNLGVYNKYLWELDQLEMAKHSLEKMKKIFC